MSVYIDDFVSLIRPSLKNDEALICSLCIMSNSTAGYACVLSGSEAVVIGTIDEIEDWLIDREIRER
jgi:hypothetical protein